MDKIYCYQIRDLKFKFCLYQNQLVFWFDYIKDNFFLVVFLTITKIEYMFLSNKNYVNNRSI